MQKKKPTAKSPLPPQKARGSLPLIFGVTLLAAAAAIVMIFRSPDDRAQTSAAVQLEPQPETPVPQQPLEAPGGASSSTGPTVPVASTWPADLPPLPLVQFPPPRPREVIQAVYQFAVRHPDVLNYVPCFCGCEHSGHRANTDCFVRSRESGGRVVWDDHGMTWAICIDVARDAMQMHTSGASVAGIRKAIEAKYRSQFPNMTPTPPAPGTP